MSLDHQQWIAARQVHAFIGIVSRGHSLTGNAPVTVVQVSQRQSQLHVEALFTPYIGALGFALFYLSAILVAILPTYLRHRRDPSYRSLGASGAVSAVLFAFILVQPWTLIFVFFIPVPAIVYAVLYVGYSIWMDRRGGDNVNHSAHLWGAGYGVLFTVMMEPRVVEVFLARLASPSF